MTEEGPRHGPEDPDQGDEGLAPPFLPGAASPAPEPPPEPAETPEPEAATPESATETSAPTTETADPASETAESAPPDGGGEPFPFETGWDAEEAGDESGDEAAWGGEGGEPAEEEAVPAHDPAVVQAQDAEDEAADDFPFEAFDIEGGGTEAAAPESTAEPEPTAAPTAPPEPPEEAVAVPTPAAGTGRRAADELADRLEDMARRLREQGAAAAESEMSSRDRFTALLAGLLAGYLAGRE